MLMLVSLCAAVLLGVPCVCDGVWSVWWWCLVLWSFSCPLCAIVCTCAVLVPLVSLLDLSCALCVCLCLTHASPFVHSNCSTAARLPITASLFVQVNTTIQRQPTFLSSIRTMTHQSTPHPSLLI